MFSEVLRHKQRSKRAVTCLVEEQIQAELGLKHNSFLCSEQESGLARLGSGGQCLSRTGHFRHCWAVGSAQSSARQQGCGPEDSKNNPEKRGKRALGR